MSSAQARATGDPDNSYIIHKLEGTQTVGRAHARNGPPYLDQATITWSARVSRPGAAP